MFTDLSSYSSRNNVADNDEARKAEEFFRVRYHYAVNAAHGMERLAFKVLPYSVIRSFALTFDPTEPFRLSSKRVGPVKRTRISNMGRGTTQRSTIHTGKQTGWAQSPNSSTCEYQDAGSDAYYPAVSQTIARTAQPAIKSRIKDSTHRLREISQDMSDLELFKYSLVAPDRHVTRSRYTDTYNTNDICHLPGVGKGSNIESRSTVGGAAYITDASVTNLRDKAIAATNQVLTDRLSGLLAGTLPNARRYTLARNVAELKDLPRTVVSLRDTVRDLSRAWSAIPEGIQNAIRHANSPKNVPGEYLSFWFGWVATFKAVQDLVNSPARIAKEVNYLISRRGLPTTLRRTVKVPGGTLTAPGWSYQPTVFSGTLWTETSLGVETATTFETELRLVMNCIFDFPGVGVPQIRSDLLDQKWGVKPSFADMYRLIPWTWLIDWFTGLGNYVDVIDLINRDQKTINWAVVSAISEGIHRSTLRTHYDNLRIRSFRHGNGPVDTYTAEDRVYTTTESRLHWKVHIRKSVPAGFGVRTTLDPSTMSSFQGSIISALLAQRAGKARYS